MPEVRTSVVSPGVGEIALNAAPRNILTSKLCAGIESGLDELRGQGARVVVLTSALDGCFVAHGSLEAIIGFFSGDAESAGDVDTQSRVMRELDRDP